MGKLETIARSQDKALSRRGFLMAGIGASLGFGFLSKAQAKISFPEIMIQEGAELSFFEPTIWCRIDQNGFVYVNIVRAEIGQHIGSALARIIADEMEADWDKIRIIYVDTEKQFSGQYVTGGSWSVWGSWDIFRQAGAAVKYSLREAAAHIFQTTAEKCIVQNGAVFYGTRRLDFGEIVAKAKPIKQFTAEEMAKFPLKAAGDYRFIGQMRQALDIPAKTTGKAIYSIDSHLDGMLYGRLCFPPTRYGGLVISVDDTQAQAVDGYEKYLILEDPSGNVPGWVIVLAHTWSSAIKAADILKIRWADTPASEVDEEDIKDHAERLIEDPKAGTDLYHDKHLETLLKSGDAHLTQTYYSDPVAHFTLEPVNAMVRKLGNIWEIHAGNQWQSLILPQIAKALGTDEDHIVMRTYLVGGGFGRKLLGDYIIPAALASQALGGRAVKLLFTRSDDMAFDAIRSPSVQKIQASFDFNQKSILAMRYDVVAGWPTLENAPAALAQGLNGKYDPFAVSGADHWYDVGAFHLRAICNDLANRTFRPGWLRSVSAGWTPWALESFIDEAASMLRIDPISFRLGLLTAQGRNGGSAPDSVGGARRQAAVLRRLVDKIDWKNKSDTLPKDVGIGVASGFGQERLMPTWIAAAAQVHVNRDTGKIICQKLWLVLDAGIIIDPDGALAQTEGAALWGLSMALFEGTEIKGGTIKARNLNNYTPIRISDVPEIDIEFVKNYEKPTGLGEPGVTVIAPAIGNAIFNAIGVRLRHLPMRSAHILEALEHHH